MIATMCTKHVAVGRGQAERQDCGGQELARNRPGWKRTVLAISTFRE